MATELILREIVERIRDIKSEAMRPIEFWMCDQLANYLIEVSEHTEVKDGTIVIKAENYTFKLKFGHLITMKRDVYNQLISFCDSEEEVYRDDPNIPTKEKRVEVL